MKDFIKPKNTFAKTSGKGKFTLEQVKGFIKDYTTVGTALIQRHFLCGYADAARVLDMLAEEGYVKHDGHQWVVIIQ